MTTKRDEPSNRSRSYYNAPQTHGRKPCTCSVRNLQEASGPVLRGTSIMDKLVEEIFSVDRKILPCNLRPVPILILHEAWNSDQITRTTNPTDGSILVFEREERSLVEGIARVTTLPPLSATLVLVNASTGSIIPTDLHTLFGQQHPCMAACGIMHAFPGLHLRILVASVSTSVINLAKHPLVCITCPSHFKIIHVTHKEAFFYLPSHLLSDSVKVVHYKPQPDRFQPTNQR